MLRRVLWALLRRRGRSAVIFISLFAVLTASLAAGLLWLAAAEARADTLRQLGTSVGIYNSEHTRPGDADYPSVIDDSLLEELRAIPHITGVYVAQGLQMMPVGFSNHKSYTGIDPATQNDASHYSEEELLQGRDAVSVAAVFELSAQTQFYRGENWLVSGNPPETLENGAVISRMLAAENGIEIGDTLQLSVTPEMLPYTDSDELEVVVTGFYDTKLYFEVLPTNFRGEAIYDFHPYNVIYVPVKTLLRVYDRDFAGYQSVDFWVDSPENSASVLEALSSDSRLRNFDTWSDTDILFRQFARPLRDLHAGARTASTTLLWFGGLSVVLLFTIWGMAYRRESGIYLALGYRKANVLLGWWLEIWLLALLAAAAALPAAFLLASALTSGTNFSWQDSMSSVSCVVTGEQNIDIRFQIRLTAEAVLLALAVVTGFSLCALVPPFVTVCKLKPREILF